jgi:NAD(P)-dependent dehydrogenase (short-subunit alcohol dehydrogenase family)
VSEFKGKVALVTGGARGIGQAIATSLGAEGAKVCVNYRSQADAAEETAQAIRESGGEAIIFQADMGDPDEVAAMVSATRSQLGPIDLLVNNAAYTHLLSHEDLTFKRWQRFIRTNLDGPFLTMWAAKEDMTKSGGGAIVNISSLGASRARADMIGYGASKAGLDQLTRASSIAFAPLHIRVNTIAAGVIDTPRADTLDDAMRAQLNKSIPLGRAGKPDEIASVALFLLSRGASYMTGEVVTVAGGPA